MKIKKKYQEKWNKVWEKEKKRNKIGRGNGGMNYPGKKSKPIRVKRSPRFQKFQKLPDDIQI